jgi:hypothetical protein
MNTPNTALFRHSHQWSRLLVLMALLALLLVSACSAPLAVPSSAPAGSERPAAEAGGSAEEGARGEAAPAESAGAWATATPSSPTQGGTHYEPVTAGVTDDNEEWQAYLDYRARHDYLWVNDRDISERYLIQVIDQHDAPVHDAMVTVYAGDQELFVGRTDTGGQVYFHPRALDQDYGVQQTGEFRLVASKGYVAQRKTVDRTGGGQWTVTLTDPPRNSSTTLDLLFLLDATGSMDDEIDKLKASMADIADQIARLPERPDVRYGLVIYRDRGDRFVTRQYDFTYDLAQFQHTLAAVRADGGGDTPESLNEALAVSLQGMSWRAEDAVRLIILVGDAPPHLDYGEQYTYDAAMIDAVARGIKIFPVGASNLDETGEYVFRQLAQFTGGKFVFLTYAEGSDPSSGPGAETEHDVETYSVDTLDRLVVRLVREELAQLTTPLALEQQPSPIAPPAPTPTPMPQPSLPIRCTLELNSRWSDCGTLIPVTWSVRKEGVAALVSFDFSQNHTERVRFELVYDSPPTGSLVELRDGLANSQDDVDLLVQEGNLIVYGNTSALEPSQDQPLPYVLPDAVHGGETLTLEVSATQVGINSPSRIEVLNSPALFPFYTRTGQPAAYATLLATFIRRGQNEQGDGGTGLSIVVITLYPDE